MYVFGGSDIKVGSLSNLWMLDLGRLSEFQSYGEYQETYEKKVTWVKIDTHGKE